MNGTYDIGDMVRLDGKFSQNTAQVDPSTVTIKVTAPDKTTATYTYAGGLVLRQSMGVYYVDIAITQRGTYRYKVVSTGTGAAAGESWFQVRTQQVA